MIDTIAHLFLNNLVGLCLKIVIAQDHGFKFFKRALSDKFKFLVGFFLAMVKSDKLFLIWLIQFLLFLKLILFSSELSSEFVSFGHQHLDLLLQG